MPHDGESGMIRASRWALFAASLVTALIAAELLLRAFGLPDSLPAPPAPSTIDPYEANPYIVSRRPYGAMFLPGSTYRAERPSYVVDYEINAHGFRGPAIESKTDRRLLVIGDSIPEGHGVPAEESVPTRLDRALNGSRWSVVSAAMQGGSPLQYAANVPRYLALEPDAVLLVLYENDLWDDRAKESNYFALPVLVDKPAPHLWTLARTLTSPPVDTPLEAQIRKNRDTPLPAYPPDPVSPIVVPTEAFEAEWNQSAAYLDALADELEKHEIPLFVLELVLEGAVTTVRGRGAQQEEGDAQMRQHREDEGRRFRDGGSSAGSHCRMVVGALRIAIRRCGLVQESPFSVVSADIGRPTMRIGISASRSWFQSSRSTGIRSLGPTSSETAR